MFFQFVQGQSGRLQNPIQTGLIASLHQFIIRCDPPGQFKNDVTIGTRLAQGRNDRLRIDDMVAGIKPKFAPFERSTGRQNDIRQPSGIGHEQVDIDKEIQVLHALDKAVVARPHALVVTECDQCLDGVGLGAEDLIGQTHGLGLLDQIGPDRKFLLPDPGRHCVQLARENEFFLSRSIACVDMHPRFRNDIIAAGNIEVAGKPAQADDSAMILDPVGMVNRGAGTGHDGGGFRRGIQSCRSLNQACRNPCNRFCLFGGELFCVCFECFESFSPGINEVGVIQSFRDDHIGHAQCQRAIRSRAQCQANIGNAGLVGDHRADFDNLQAVFTGLKKSFRVRGAGGEGVLAPQEKALGMPDVRTSPAAIGQFGGDIGGKVAGTGFGGKVGCAETDPQSLDKRSQPFGVPDAENH